MAANCSMTLSAMQLSSNCSLLPSPEKNKCSIALWAAMTLSRNSFHEMSARLGSMSLGQLVKASRL